MDKMWVAIEHENILICIETAGKIISTVIVYRIESNIRAWTVKLLEVKTLYDIPVWDSHHKSK